MNWYQHPYEAAQDGVWPRLRTGIWVSLAVTLIVGLLPGMCGILNQRWVRSYKREFRGA